MFFFFQRQKTVCIPHIPNINKKPLFIIRLGYNGQLHFTQYGNQRFGQNYSRYLRHVERFSVMVSCEQQLLSQCLVVFASECGKTSQEKTTRLVQSSLAQPICLGYVAIVIVCYAMPACLPRLVAFPYRQLKQQKEFLKTSVNYYSVRYS